MAFTTDPALSETYLTSVSFNISRNFLKFAVEGEPFTGETTNKTPDDIVYSIWLKELTEVEGNQPYQGEPTFTNTGGGGGGCVRPATGLIYPRFQG